MKTKTLRSLLSTGIFPMPRGLKPKAEMQIHSDLEATYHTELRRRRKIERRNRK